MRQDRPFDIAMRIVGMRGDTEAYRDAVAAIARAIRSEVKRAVRPLKEAIKACDWSYGHAQTEEVRQKIDLAMGFDPFCRLGDKGSFFPVSTVSLEPAPKEWDQKPKGCWIPHPLSGSICQLPNDGHTVHKRLHGNGLQLECWRTSRQRRTKR